MRTFTLIKEADESIRNGKESVEAAAKNVKVHKRPQSVSFDIVRTSTLSGKLARALAAKVMQTKEKQTQQTDQDGIVVEQTAQGYWVVVNGVSDADQAFKKLANALGE